jgi:hypothetical protein
MFLLLHIFNATRLAIVDLQKVQKMSMRVDKGISAPIVQVRMIQDNMHKCSTCTEAQTFAQHNKQVLV